MVMNQIGAQVGINNWFPTLDRSKSIGMGNVLPFEPGKLLGPTKDVKGQELAQIQRASGAGFGNVFAFYNFLNSQDDLRSLKRWEGIMPRFMSNVSHSFRYLTKGEEVNRAGNPVVKFDPHDTMQMAEILARGLGYQPRRLTAQWEALGAKTEAATFFDLRKELLLRQFGAAIREQDTESKARVIEAVKAYNAQLPEEWKAKSISAKTLRESVMNRARVRAKQEANVPIAKQDVPGFRAMDKYFPEGRPTGQVDARTVK